MSESASVPSSYRSSYAILIGCKRRTTDTLSTQTPATAKSQTPHPPSIISAFNHTHIHAYLKASNGPFYRVALLSVQRTSSVFVVCGFLGFERMVSIRAKRLRAEAAEIERFEALPPLEKLQRIQVEIGKVNTEAKAKISDVERKTVYWRRNEIISNIPNFWLKVFLKHPILKKLLTKEDEEILGYLDSLHVDNFEDRRKGYYIKFHFKPNPYFTNTPLTKTIKFSSKGTLWSRGTTIHWVAAKGPVEVVNDAREGNTEPSSSESFFSCFGSPEGDVVEMDQDWIADIIHRELWPNPLKCIENADDDEDDVGEENKDDKLIP